MSKAKDFLDSLEADQTNEAGLLNLALLLKKNGDSRLMDELDKGGKPLVNEAGLLVLSLLLKQNGDSRLYDELGLESRIRESAEFKAHLEKLIDEASKSDDEDEEEDEEDDEDLDSWGSPKHPDSKEGKKEESLAAKFLGKLEEVYGQRGPETRSWYKKSSDSEKLKHLEDSLKLIPAQLSELRDRISKASSPEQKANYQHHLKSLQLRQTSLRKKLAELKEKKPKVEKPKKPKLTKEQAASAKAALKEMPF